MDRLAAFFEAFKLSVRVVPPTDASAAVKLFVLGSADGGAESIVFAARGGQPTPPATIVAASVDFGSTTNPLMNAMPERFAVSLSDAPVLRETAAAFVAEALDNRCGRSAAINRLGEVIVLLMLRRVIDVGTAAPGLLAGLAHPMLHRALVAMHDSPSREWRVEDLASVAGMSRSRFMPLFHEIVGTTPMSYLNKWRLCLGHRELIKGALVKSVARQVGFGSAAAFSRAYAREFGRSPIAARG